MFRIRLVLVSTEDRWVFRVGKVFRLVNAAAALAFIAAGLALDAFWVPAVLTLLALSGALYEESATFDRSTGQATFRLGLVFWHRRRVIGLEEVTAIRLTTFGAAHFTSLEVAAQGRTFTIENDRGKPSTERLNAWGSALAEWLKVPLET